VVTTIKPSVVRCTRKTRDGRPLPRASVSKATHSALALSLEARPQDVTDCPRFCSQETLEITPASKKTGIVVRRSMLFAI